MKEKAYIRESQWAGPVVGTFDAGIDKLMME